MQFQVVAYKTILESLLKQLPGAKNITVSNNFTIFYQKNDKIEEFEYVMSSFDKTWIEDMLFIMIPEILNKKQSLINN